MTNINSLTKKDIKNAIDFEPGLKAHSNIIVHFDDGVVLLSGSVQNYYAKTLAEKTVKNVYGVRGVVDELEVILGESLRRSDSEIAKAAVQALEWDTALPQNKIKIVVAHGVVTLSGEVEFYYQRSKAYENVRPLFGIKNIINNITIASPATINPTKVADKILAEFQRNATIDARKVQVEVEGNAVVLKGFVRSWTEYEEARRAAWSVPGVTSVDSSQLIIKYQTD